VRDRKRGGDAEKEGRRVGGRERKRKKERKRKRRE